MGSSSYQTYVGPYLRCSVRTIPVTRTVKVCTKGGCRFGRAEAPMEGKPNFCPQCGSPSKDIEIEVEGRVRDALSTEWCYNICEGEERVRPYNNGNSEPGVHLFVPNVDCLREFIFDRWSAKVGELQRVRAATLEQDMMWFESHFEREIIRAVEVYGEDKVEVRWGVLGEFL
jgi:hypothetical protein